MTNKQRHPTHDDEAVMDGAPGGMTNEKALRNDKKQG
jgi:hypothetical protein